MRLYEGAPASGVPVRLQHDGSRVLAEAIRTGSLAVNASAILS